MPNNYCISIRLLTLLTTRTETIASRFDPYYLEASVATPLSQLAAWLVDFKPGLVGFSVNIWNRNESFELAREIRQLSPGTTLLAGGQEMTNSVTDYLSRIPSLDYVIDGEGEIPWCQFLSAFNSETGHLTDPQTVSGLWFRHRGRSQFTRPAEYHNSLDGIPSPILAGLVSWQPTLNLGIMIEGSRGCPFRCSFCFEGAKNGRVRTASLERIIDEINFMAIRGATYFHLLDPILGNGDLSRIRVIAEAFRRLRAKNDRMQISLEMHPDELRPELAEYLADFSMIDVGLQSINPETNRTIHRRFDAEKFTSQVHCLNEAKADFNIYLIAGLPHETLASCLRGIFFAIQQNPTRLFINELCLLNGTELRWEAAKYGYEFDENPPYIVQASRWMSKRDFRIIQTCSKIISLYYNYSANSRNIKAPWLRRGLPPVKDWQRVPLPGQCVLNCPGCASPSGDSRLEPMASKAMLDKAEGQNINLLAPYPLNLAQLASYGYQFTLAGAARLKLTTPPQSLLDPQLPKLLRKWGIWYFETFYRIPETIDALKNLSPEELLMDKCSFRPIIEIHLRPKSEATFSYQEQVEQLIRPASHVLIIPEDRADDLSTEMAASIFDQAIWSDCWVKLPISLLRSALGNGPDLEEIVRYMDLLNLVSYESEQLPCFRPAKE
jgi:radical SAM superfamily enzyme YgiQ (UPF0313 family)